jgi:hypothetical protein
VYRCTLDGAVLDRQYLRLAGELEPLLVEDYPHLAMDARLAKNITPGAVSLCFAPLLRILLKGGGAVVIGPPDLMRRSLEQLGLQTRIPVVENEEQAHEAILRMIPKRYSNSFFSLLLQEGVATAVQIRDLHAEYKRQAGTVPFGRLLVQRGFCTTLDLLRLLDKTDNPDRYAIEGSEDVSGEFKQDLTASAVRRMEDIKAGAEAEQPEPEAGQTVDLPPPARDLPKYSRGDLSTFGPAVSEFHQPRLLGEILLESGLITGEQLRLAVSEQRARSEEIKLGDLLVQKGLLNPTQLFEALEVQVSRRGAGGNEAVAEMRSEFVQKSLIGEILVEMGLIREQDLKVALDEQKDRPGTKIGGILLQMGVVNTDSLLQALERQANRKP